MNLITIEWEGLYPVTVSGCYSNNQKTMEYEDDIIVMLQSK